VTSAPQGSGDPETHGTPQVLRLAAFAEHPDHGNPAGVVLDAAGFDAASMLAIAADVGYSETAFVTALDVVSGECEVRYFSPQGEVDFCGHATVATVVALAEHAGRTAFSMSTRAGIVHAHARDDDGMLVGAFRSPPASNEPLDEDARLELLRILGWSEADLEPALPPAVGVAGNRHPVLAARRVDRLATLDYDLEALRALCVEHGWTTVQLIARESQGVWRSRNPFPLGGVVEDPATGAAAAAFVGYLRDRGLLAAGERLTIHQGVEMGRPSRIDLEVEESRVVVSGPVSRIASR
jgi:PhzF family phenazine biosynthesis protein